MKDPAIQRMANEHNKSPAQILLRYAIQRGLFVIPKSEKKERIIENGNIFDFKLHTSDMQTLFGMNKNQRFFPMDYFDHKYYPFRENYSELWNYIKIIWFTNYTVNFKFDSTKTVY